MFKKYKHGNASKRLIWVTPLFDFLCWGDENKATVKGYMPTRSIEEINQGLPSVFVDVLFECAVDAVAAVCDRVRQKHRESLYYFTRAHTRDRGQRRAYVCCSVCLCPSVSDCCCDAEMAKEWIEAFEFLIQLHKAYEEKKKEMSSKAGFKDKLELARSESTKLLTEGDIFKKWPGKKIVQKGAFTVRKIWASPNVDKLYVRAFSCCCCCFVC